MKFDSDCDLLIGNRPKNDSDEQCYECDDCYRYDICKKYYKSRRIDRMSISEQIENLRRIAKEWNPDTPINPVSVTLNEAADTIESLSAKLQAEDCCGWILCSTGNMPDIGSAVLIQFKSDINGITGDDDRTFDISCMRSRDNSEWFCSTGKYSFKDVKAWKPIKSCHEP